MNINKYLENEFKMILFDNKVDIQNYKSIIHFDSVKVIVECSDKTITIKGENLVVSKLLTDELLISGNINLIEFR